MRKSKSTVLAISGLALLITGAMLYAGPLNPPAGPVTSTYKTLSEVEPRIAINAINTPGDADSLFKITQPGSYYLTGNVIGVVGKHGIEITAHGVTVDLGGFGLQGIAGTLDGVSATVPLRNVAVINGVVWFWGGDGVDLSNVISWRLADLMFADNIGHGIRGGSSGALNNCTSVGNNGDGIALGGGSTATNCGVQFNTGNGISAVSGCTITNCSVVQSGISGISAGNASIITSCTVVANQVGILCSSTCVIRGNSCVSNGTISANGAGIRASGSDNRIEGNNCTGAGRGVEVNGTGSIIIGNTCSGNTFNWTIAIGNSVGPIVLAGQSAAINGNGPLASSLGSTDPFANFSY